MVQGQDVVGEAVKNGEAVRNGEAVNGGEALNGGEAVNSGEKKATIDARIEYTSSDSMVIMGNGIAHIYGSGDLKYKTMGLTAEYIRVSMDSSTIFAKGVLDTIENEWIGQPVFSEGQDSYETEEITYNLKTQKGFIHPGLLQSKAPEHYARRCFGLCYGLHSFA